MSELELGMCSLCGEVYMVNDRGLNSRDLCDGCIAENQYRENRLISKEIELRNWADKHIRQQWNKSAKESAASLIAKCNGARYR